MAQLVERLLPTPEFHGSNPDIGNFTYCIEKDENKGKMPIMAQLKRSS